MISFAECSARERLALLLDAVLVLVGRLTTSRGIRD